MRPSDYDSMPITYRLLHPLTIILLGVNEALMLGTAEQRQAAAAVAAVSQQHSF